MRTVIATSCKASQQVNYLRFSFSMNIPPWIVNHDNLLTGKQSSLTLQVFTTLLLFFCQNVLPNNCKTLKSPLFFF